MPWWRLAMFRAKQRLSVDEVAAVSMDDGS
jgi:hypothetical protein